MFSLPSYWVFVHYENGKKVNVSNRNSLSRPEAESFAKHWVNPKQGKINRVTLEDMDGNEITRHDFRT